MIQSSKWILLALPIAVSLPAGSSSAAAAASADRTPGASAVTGGHPISLAEARARALASSPELDAARQAAAAAGGVLRQAHAWANPELQFDAEEFGGDQPGWDEAEITWTLSQRLELFGTRSARARAALHGRDAAVLSADAARLELLAEVDRRFADALVAQSRTEALQASDSVAIETVRAVTALVEAGEVSPIEVDRAEAERALVATRLAAAGFDRARSLRSLAQLWGGREPDFAAVQGALEIVPPLPDRDSLLAALPEIPDLERADAEVRRAEAEVSLAARARLPDLAIHGGLKRLYASGEQSYVGGIGLSLPVLDRNGGALDETRARLGQARAERTAAHSRIELALATAYDALATALETSRRYREVSLRAHSIHTSVQEGYRRGKFGLLDLIDARRFSLEAELEYIDALRSVWIARADLARLAGRSVPSSEGDSQ